MKKPLRRNKKKVAETCTVDPIKHFTKITYSTVKLMLDCVEARSERIFVVAL